MMGSPNESRFLTPFLATLLDTMRVTLWPAVPFRIGLANSFETNFSASEGAHCMVKMVRGRTIVL